MRHWLVKTEPGTYSWNDLARDKTTAWTGVRNPLARMHLRAMKTGDLVFVYHSGKEKSIVGIAKVARAAYPDETAATGEWVAVDLRAVRPLVRPITLADIKSRAALKSMVLVNNSRLSVQPVTEQEWGSVNP